MNTLCRKTCIQGAKQVHFKLPFYLEKALNEPYLSHNILIYPIIFTIIGLQIRIQKNSG